MHLCVDKDGKLSPTKTFKHKNHINTSLIWLFKRSIQKEAKKIILKQILAKIDENPELANNIASRVNYNFEKGVSPWRSLKKKDFSNFQCIAAKAFKRAGFERGLQKSTAWNAATSRDKLPLGENSGHFCHLETRYCSLSDCRKGAQD